MAYPRPAFTSHRSSAGRIGFGGLGLGGSEVDEWVQAKGNEETAATLDRVQPGDVSIYLSTRSRRINGSAAGNFSRCCVCRPDPHRMRSLGEASPKTRLSRRDGRLRYTSWIEIIRETRENRRLDRKADGILKIAEPEIARDSP